MVDSPSPPPRLAKLNKQGGDSDKENGVSGGGLARGRKVQPESVKTSKATQPLTASSRRLVLRDPPTYQRELNYIEPGYGHSAASYSSRPQDERPAVFPPILPPVHEHDLAAQFLVRPHQARTRTSTGASGSSRTTLPPRCGAPNSYARTSSAPSCRG